MAQAIGKATKFVQLAKALALSGNWAGAAEYVEQNYHVWRDLPLAAKSAVEATSWADMQNSTAWQGIIEEFVEQIRPYSVFDTMAPSMVEVELNAAVTAATQAVQGNAVLPRPISRFSLDGDRLAVKNAGGVVVISESALQHATGRNLLFNELRRAVVQATDKTFLTDIIEEVGENTLPATSSGPGADVKALLDVVATQGSESLFLAIRPELANALCTREDNAPAFADLTPNGGSLFGVRTLVSANLPPADSTGHTILLFDAGGIGYGEGTITLSSTNGGIIDLSDDPEGSSIVSLFQADLVAVKVSRHFGWKTIRDNAVACMSSVDW